MFNFCVACPVLIIINKKHEVTQDIGGIMPSARQNHSFSLDDVLTIAVFFFFNLMSVSAPPAPAPAGDGAEANSDDAGQAAFNWTNLFLPIVVSFIFYGVGKCEQREEKSNRAKENEQRAKTDQERAKKLEDIETRLTEIEKVLATLQKSDESQQALQAKRDELSQFVFGQLFFDISDWKEQDVLPYLDNFTEMLVPVLKAIRAHVGISEADALDEQQLQILMPIIEEKVRDYLVVQGLLKWDLVKGYMVDLAQPVVINKIVITQILQHVSKKFLQENPSPRRMQRLPSLKAVGHAAMAASHASKKVHVVVTEGEDTVENQLDAPTVTAKHTARLRGIKPSASSSSTARKRAPRRKRKGLKPGEGAAVTPASALHALAQKRLSGAEEEQGQNAAPTQPRGGLSPSSKAVAH